MSAEERDDDGEGERCLTYGVFCCLGCGVCFMMNVRSER